MKGAEKPNRASPVGLHKQIGLNCTGCGPSTAGRATAMPMARQQSERQKPRHIQIASISVMAWKHERAIRGGKARRFLLPGSRRDPRWDWLLCPISRIARGRAHRLTASGLKSEHGNLDCLPGWKPGSLRRPDMDNTKGGAFVVVGVWESHAHGEGKQEDDWLVKTEE